MPPSGGIFFSAAMPENRNFSVGRQPDPEPFLNPVLARLQVRFA
jgi:hypothetical protein